ncbi:MAG: hypothetical protein DHS20C01_14560 [marine bacterium B5-7]|nr:MAG: hypothetical protein DHS20C01_14560 [marine bacterium B5-7]
MIAPSLQKYWDGRAAGNFVFGGAGSGLIISTAIATPFNTASMSAALLIGACLIALGLLLVWFEIGRPLRFINVLRNPYTSWMSREAWTAIVLLPLTLAAFALPTRGLVIPAAFVALLFLYCQARILRASAGVPTWRQRGTMALIVTTGLTEGAGLYLLLYATGLIDVLSLPIPLLITAVLFIGGRYATWRSWLHELQGNAPTESLSVMRTFAKQFIVVGHLLPIVLIVVAWLIPAISDIVLAVSGVLVLLSGWTFKTRLILSASHIQGFAIEHTPARGGGRSGPGVKPGWS